MSKPHEITSRLMPSRTGSVLEVLRHFNKHSQPKDAAVEIGSPAVKHVASLGVGGLGSRDVFVLKRADMEARPPSAAAPHSQTPDQQT